MIDQHLFRMGWHVFKAQSSPASLVWNQPRFKLLIPFGESKCTDPSLRFNWVCDMFARNRWNKHPQRDCRPSRSCWSCHSRLAHCRHVNPITERYRAHGANWTCGIFRGHGGCVLAWPCGHRRLRSGIIPSRSDGKWACLPRHSGGYISAFKVDSGAFALSKSLGRATLHSENHEQASSNVFLAVYDRGGVCPYFSRLEHERFSSSLASCWRYLFGVYTVVCDPRGERPCKSPSWSESPAAFLHQREQRSWCYICI